MELSTFTEIGGDECYAKIRRNISNDLSLLYSMNGSWDTIVPVTFDGMFCTTERKDSGLDHGKVNNVEDAYIFLFDRMMKYDSKKKTQKQEKRELYGTFEIYTGIVDSISTNSAKRNENEFKFTPA